jgi:hypothetical protein
MKTLTALTLCIGFFVFTASAYADCTLTDISENSTVNGELSSTDCILESDNTYMDLYRVTLASGGVLTVRMESSAIDSYLVLLPDDVDSMSSDTITDDDSGGGRNSLISLSRDAGAYIIVANSYAVEMGPYTLTVSFEPETQDGPIGAEEIPLEPVLDISTSGMNVTASWNSISNATRYTLFYAPYPDASYIGSVDMGNQTSVSVDLWEGAAFYVAVQAYNSAGNSDYSNITSFVIESGSDSLQSLSGSYTYETYNPTLSGDCDLISDLIGGSSMIIGTHGQMEVEQSGQDITVMIKSDEAPELAGLEGTFSGIHDGWIELNGTINGNTFDAAYAESGSLYGFSFSVGLSLDGTMEGDSFSGDMNATVSSDFPGFNENCNVGADYQAQGR